jgi:hypothetical protein
MIYPAGRCKCNNVLVEVMQSCSHAVMQSYGRGICLQCKALGIPCSVVF